MSPEQLDFRNTRILVIGDLMLDQYWIGESTRISPEAPVPIVKINTSENRLGGAANAALNARSLGSNVALCGIIGEDANGLIIKQLIQQNKIQNLVLESSDAQTINKLRLISRNQQMLRADFEQAFPEMAVAELTRNCLPQVEEFAVVVLSDYNKGTLSQCAKLISEANKHGTKVIIDPKGSDFTMYRDAYLLTPNMQEFEAIVGKCLDEQDMFSKAHQLIEDVNLQALLLTRSENGMTLFTNDGKHQHFNAMAREVFDVTGAGDTVIATLACAIAANIPLAEAVMLANTAASIVVGRMGAASVTPLELKLALEQQSNQPKGICELESLKSLIAFERSLGKRIVFTNGCFDILHAGHVQYLNEAAQLGDRLIVAVNSDASVKRLKGETRPINTVNDRMAVLSSLAAVDWVISFEDDTPEALLEALQPDILVKGGDYTENQVVGAEIVHGYGGEVAILSLQEGVSTTRIIDSIRAY